MTALAAKTAVSAPPAGSGGLLAHTVPAGWLIAALFAWLGLDQLLLWRFLDVAPFWAYPLALLLIGGLCGVMLRTMPDRSGPSIGTLLLCTGVSLLLLMLGGEGRFFYANVDWQVRLAALRDMAVNPWPFVYTERAVPYLLRAPIGMFLAPALLYKALGVRAGDIALLAQNALLLSLTLALAAQLFDGRRGRLVALLVFLGFSGIDAIGDLVLNGRLGDHLEDWIGLQYSSTITLAFWVPQHAMSGWIGAMGYLLWRHERLPLASYLALLPLTALWSPLGLMGAMPFAALAGIRTLAARRLRIADMLLPALASLLAVPSLLYLGAASGADVGLRFQPIPPLQWLMFQGIETLPYLVPLLLVARPARFGRDTLWLAFAWLMLIPFVQIGWSIDFMARASITALAILAAMLVDELGNGTERRTWLIAMLLIGSLTGLAEIRRALVHPPAPEVRCSVSKAWDQTFAAFPKGSYFAPLPAMPALVRPARPTPVPASEPARCWDGLWFSPHNFRQPGSGGENRVK
ncbi:hypothetical protein [Sphingobium yanoikuyae]|uniref:hypothetical protein n=1 Tax=Sphingobium yanoikuyae TaxID=13690 RepID=UPI0028AA00E4|nr:hypothetical protein [Sphingobium yanoikuyae]